MPNYFGFEAVGALLLDPESKSPFDVINICTANTLFTDPDYSSNPEIPNEDFSDQDEDGPLGQNYMSSINANPKQAKHNAEFSEKFEDEKSFITKRLEMLKKMTERKFNKFPVTSGLSGAVF